jgi:hypothetical protein
MRDEQKTDLERRAELALRAMNRGLKKAFLGGEAYDPDGKGKAYWQAQDLKDADLATQQK